MVQKSAERKELTTAQQRAMEALLQAGSLTEAAVLAGTHRNTLRRWMAEPAFVAALREIESEALTALSRRLVFLGEQAAAVLADALAPEQDVKTRLKAAEIVLANLLKLRELLDFDQRLAALEATQHEND